VINANAAIEANSFPAFIFKTPMSHVRDVLENAAVREHPEADAELARVQTGLRP
jgi:hypothetical protein